MINWVFPFLLALLIALLVTYLIYRNEESNIPHYHNDDDIPGVYHDEEGL
jgi:hypothetical protein